MRGPFNCLEINWSSRCDCYSRQQKEKVNVTLTETIKVLYIKIVPALVKA